MTVGTLKTLGDALVDIHGQHEHQSLLATERHADLLDLWAGADVARQKAAVLEAHEAARAARREWDALLRDARERARNLDLLAFQRDEIDAAAPKDGEDDALATERVKLGGAERLHGAAQAAYKALRDGALDALGTAASEIEHASRLDPTLSPLLESLQSALYAADDAARDLRAYRDGVEFNPGAPRRDRNPPSTRSKPCGVSTASLWADVLAYRAEIGERLETLENAEERLASLEAATKSAETHLAAQCKKLTEARKKAAVPFSKAIQAELKDLAMAATRFAVSIEPKEPGAGGADAIELLLSPPTPASRSKPLAKIASGGELSRIMLALKSVMAKNVAPPVMVFDEIDTGIGGRTGTILAEKLHTLAGSRPRRSASRTSRRSPPRATGTSSSKSASKASAP